MTYLSNNQELIRKYNVPTPRYTSYPTVPFWDTEGFRQASWATLVQDAFYERGKKEGLSLYIHLPFCESLCTYCGCNTRITVNHAVELRYITTLLKEWEMYVALFDEAPTIKELHLGGGTPTFFSPENLELLLKGILSRASVSKEAEFSFEGHPNNTTEGHLRSLYSLGFRRVSFGIQDFDPKVQEVIHRKQSFGQVEYVTDLARLIGYTSINFDLIYGLPLQTKESVVDTVEKVKRLRPDRIAFYSYAHVPWIKPGQRNFTEADLPDNESKLALYEEGRRRLEEAGYAEIGMDHFALPSDSLYQAAQQGQLHRNFMGYTATSTSMLIGLGCSSISDTGTAYAQNEKKVEDYNKAIKSGQFALTKGHVLTEEDEIWKQHILDISCRFETRWNQEKPSPHAADCQSKLQALERDGLVECTDSQLKVTLEGRRFLRSICAAFDARLNEQEEPVTVFSKAV